jgi:hypothetical protein
MELAWELAEESGARARTTRQIILICVLYHDRDTQVFYTHS